MNQFTKRSKSFAGIHLLLEKSLHSVHLSMTFERLKNAFSIDFYAVIKHYNAVNDMEYSSGQKTSSLSV